MAISPDQPIRADDFINESEASETPSDDVGKVPKLESNGILSKKFLPISPYLDRLYTQLPPQDSVLEESGFLLITCQPRSGGGSRSSGSVHVEIDGFRVAHWDWSSGDGQIGSLTVPLPRGSNYRIVEGGYVTTNKYFIKLVEPEVDAFQFPTVMTTNSQTGHSTLTPTVNLPNGLQEGDFCLIIANVGDGGIFTTPSGWSMAGGREYRGDTKVFYRVMQPGDDLNSVQLSLSTALAANYISYRITGVNSIDPIKAMFTTSNSNTMPTLETGWIDNDTLWISLIGITRGISRIEPPNAFYRVNSSSSTPYSSSNNGNAGLATSEYSSKLPTLSPNPFSYSSGGSGTYYRRPGLIAIRGLNS